MSGEEGVDIGVAGEENTGPCNRMDSSAGGAGLMEMTGSMLRSCA